MELDELKELTEKAELQYAPIPDSGIRSGLKIKLNDIVNKLKPFSVRKPVAFIVGSLAINGETDNDIDIVVRGEDWSEEQKTAFDFRIYRMFADILNVPYNEITKYVQIHYTNTGPFTPYIPIYEETMLPIENPTIIQMSEDIYPISIDGSFNIVSKSSRRIIAGYASVVTVDKEGDIIPISALKEGIKTLLSDPHYANIMLTHNNIQIGRIIPEYNGLKTHVDDKGLFIVAEIRSDLEIADEVWKRILNGELNGFSIAGEIIKQHKECDPEKCYNIVDKLNIFEVSVCKQPMNPLSGFIVVSKSQDVCDNVKNKEIKMESEDLVIEEENIEKDEETEEEKVLSHAAASLSPPRLIDGSGITFIILRAKSSFSLLRFSFRCPKKEERSPGDTLKVTSSPLCPLRSSLAFSRRRADRTSCPKAGW